MVASALLACALAAIPAVMAAGQENDKQVTICHATSSERNPYVQNHPAIRNNGDLLGGHLGHADDIIPPYLQYSDPDGTEQWFGGQNWTGPGQAIWEKDCDVEPEPPTPSTRIAVVKSLSPRDDPGRFDLKVGSTTVAENIGNNGTGAASVEPGTPYTVSEAGVGGTNLGDFDIASRCTATDGSDVGTSHGESVSGVTVAEGKTVTCVFTNTRKPPPDSESITPELECVLFKDGQPDVAYWSYNNTNGHDVVIPQGDQNTFVPSSANGPAKPPTRFLAGHQVGAFTTDVPAGGSLVWSLTGISSDPASADSESCNATTIEVRKVTVPANDPGKFILLINNAEVASGGHGTTSGHLAIGAGEATVRETAGPGTNLGDYTSKVECTNGTATRSAEGAKIDGKIAKGDTVVCTFTNTRKGAPPQPPEPLPPTPPNPDPEPVPPTPPGPAPQLDLVVTKSVVPETVVVGGRLTWTMIVTNRSSVAAADVNGVKVDDPRSFRTRLISLRASQGTCRPYTCDLGRLAPGASARVIAVSEATRVGVVVEHCPRQLGGAGVELPQQRRGRDRPGRRSPHPSIRSEPLRHADRRAQDPAEQAIVGGAAHGARRSGPATCWCPSARARPGCGHDRHDRPPGHRAPHRPAETHRPLLLHRAPQGADRRRHALPDTPRSPRRVRHARHGLTRRSTGLWRSAFRAARAAGAAERRRWRRECSHAKPPARATGAGSCRGSRPRPSASRSLARTRSSRARTSRRTDPPARTRTGRRSRARAASPCPRRPTATVLARSSLPSRTRRTSSVRAPSRTMILFTTGRTSTASARTQPRAPFGRPGRLSRYQRSPSRPRRDARASTIWNWWSGRNRCIRRTIGAEDAGAERTATACVSSPAAGNAVVGAGGPPAAAPADAHTVTSATAATDARGRPATTAR